MSPNELLRELLRRAQDAGLNEGRLAELSGLTPQGLSKAKARGDLRVSTLEALGRELGLELAWRPLRQTGDLSRRVRLGNLFEFGDKDRGED